MAIIQINSTDPKFGYIIKKNPNSGMLLRTIRKGSVFAWYSNEGESFNILFKDADNAVSFGFHPVQDTRSIEVTIKFDGTGSHIPIDMKDDVYFVWDFGDGNKGYGMCPMYTYHIDDSSAYTSFATGSLKKVTHTVTLNLMDKDGNILHADMTTITITFPDTDNREYNSRFRF